MRILCCYVIPILALGLVGQLHAQEELPIGARPMGMSGAFSAIADDANAIMWNPAGITQLTQQELTSMWTELYSSEVTQSHLGYVQPIASRFAVGIDWTAFQFDDVELSYNRHRIHLAGAYRPSGWLSCGLNVKLLYSSTKLDNISEGDTQRIDGDIGVLLWPLSAIESLENVKIAFVLRDAANTDISHKYQGGFSYESISARRGIIGIAYEELLPNLTISVDSDIEFEERLRVGSEYHLRALPIDMEAMLRAGLYKDWGTEARLSWALGGSLGVPISNYAKAFFEYAYLDSPQLPGTHRIAMRVPFDFNPTAVSIVNPRCDDLFASLYRRYEKHPVITMTLLNKQDQAIKPQMTSAVKGYEADPLNVPTLGGRTQQNFSFPIKLSGEILEVQQDRLSITLEAKPPKGLRFEPTQAEFSAFIHPSGKVPWTKVEGVKPYVAFITYEDPYVTQFARNVTERYRDPGQMEQLFPPGNKIPYERSDLEKLFQAIQIYESLRSYGIYYRLDRNQGHMLTESVAGGMQFIEDIKYPRDYLLSDDLGGDCDDWAVLYASLLESVGIMTALIEIPGHVFVMFNTEVTYGTEYEARIHLKKDRFIDWNDPEARQRTVWIPVEVPQELDVSFYQCWEDGLKSCREKKDDLRIVLVREAQKDYPPALFKQSGQQVREPDFGLLDSYLKEAFSQFTEEWERYWEE
ncbi:hypothetical protein ACFL6S_00845 [Candidatus Poribacteria bacterium]